MSAEANRADAGSSLEPRPQDAIDFLRHWAPDGPWCLATIAQEGGNPVVRTFTPDQADAAATWIGRQNKKRWNTYFQVNAVKGSPTKKPGKDGIAAALGLHADLDPDTGRDLESEQRRIRGRLAEAEPKPTVVIFSGGGYQGFWQFCEPDSNLKETEGRNLALLRTLEGPPGTHNIDRLMRLPGTINWPKASKRENGQRPTLAHVVAELTDWSRVCQPADFAGAIDEDAVADNGAGADDNVIDLEERELWRRFESLLANDPRVRARWEGDPTGLKDATRSGFDLSMTGLLRTRGFRPAEIRTILRKYVYGRGENGDRRYHARMDKRSAACEPHPEILAINGKYFAALEGGKVRFFREEADGSLASMDRQAFIFELGDRWMEVPDANGKIKTVHAVEKWLRDKARRYYRRGFILDPEGAAPDQYNLWRGFAVEPAPGDWSLMKAHIGDVLAAGDKTHAEYIMRWTAWAFQNPSIPARVALIFIGFEGVGKGVFLEHIRQAFGIHGMRVQNMAHFTGKFNAHLRHLCFLFADEAVVPGSDGEGALKGLITEATIPIEKKGVDVVVADNHLHVALASNRDWAIPAGMQARRFAVFEVADTHRGDSEYFTALWRQMKEGGLAAMLYDMLHMDLGDWHPETHRPDTAALNTQKSHSLEAFSQVWLDILRTGELPTPEIVQKSGEVFASTSVLREAAGRRRKRDDFSDQMISSLFTRMGFERVTNKRPRGWTIPPLLAARQQWDEIMFSVEWDDANEWVTTSPEY